MKIRYVMPRTINGQVDHMVASIHGIKPRQRLRVVMKLPAGPMAYDRDAIVVDAGDGVPLILWSYQVVDYEPLPVKRKSNP